jgi:hypothetical protein
MSGGWVPYSEKTCFGLRGPSLLMGVEERAQALMVSSLLQRFEVSHYVFESPATRK